MSEAIKAVTFMNLIFVIFLMLSGTVGGLFGELVYYLAFLIPIALGFYVSSGLKIKREEIAGVSEPPERILSFDIKKGRAILPLIFPSVTVIFLVSFITALLLSAFGVNTAPVADDGIFKMLLVHAVVPALFEEALFRYVPMKLLLPYSKRLCVFYSALCFALIHCSFAQMPYAFVAGVIFMIIDVALESVWPSVILHLVNNSASVIWMKYCSENTASWIFISVLLILTLVSCVIIYRHREEYRDTFYGALDKGEDFAVTYAPAILIIICSYIATVELIS